MKPLLLTAALLGLTFSVQAADPAVKPAPAPKTAPAAPGTKKADPPKTEDKPMPMNHKVDSIDAAAKTFTYTTKKGTKVVHTVTEKTEIFQGDKPATFADIKVGDTVSGLHIKHSDTAYEVVKITKFGPAETKEEKKADKKDAAPKKDATPPAPSPKAK
ncbi:MAG: hypothetical protein JWO82_4328 [Akkermansiaceae bacterium]|nr:hypothetical protein [Akkermansiaceae bacterium]